MGALDGLFRAYERLDPGRRKVVDALLTDWILSDDGDLRYDALELVQEFRIRSALPALGELVERLRGAESPRVRDELPTVERAITSLTGAPES